MDTVNHTRKFKALTLLVKDMEMQQKKKIMKELVRNGAVNGEMSFPRVASMYKSGIITSNGMVELHKKVSSLA